MEIENSLDSALALLINKALEGVEASTTFLQAELPEVITQLLMWHGVHSAVMSVIWMLTLGALIYLDKKLYSLAKDCNDPDVLLQAWGIFGCIPRLLYLVPLSMINLTWLKIWVAPKVWLLEYSASLVK